jgi:hypothetical protein
MRIDACGFYRLYLIALLGAVIWTPGRTAVPAQVIASTANRGLSTAGEGKLLTHKDTIVLGLR